MSVGKYEKIDSVEKWLGAVAYANSGSSETERRYRSDFNRFLSFIDKTADEILAEYKALKSWNDFRLFGDKIADYIKGWIIALNRSGLANNTIKNMIGAIQSFLKYNRIDIGFIPTAKDHVQYHNRDIKREEIAAIMYVSLPRDRAFYVVSAQSGLRPATICRLQRKHIEYNRLLRGESPAKIEVPQIMAKGKYQAYFTFISDEAIQHLKHYLNKRANLTSESYLFVKQGTENEPMKPSAFSAQFNKTVRKLREKGVLDFEVRKDKPSEIRLYSLRKFFKKYSNQAGESFSEFWMGHKGKGVTDNYRAKDPEYHRSLYAELAAPHLRIEAKTPTQTEKQIEDLRKQLDEAQKKLEERDRITSDRDRKLAPLLDFVNDFDNPSDIKRFFEILKEDFILDSMENKGAIVKMDFPPELDKRLKKVAELEGKPVSTVIREAVIYHTTKEKKAIEKRKAAKKQEGE